MPYYSSFVASGDRGSSHTTSNSSKDSSAGITNTNLHQVVSGASTAAANNTAASSATSLMSKALAGFGTGSSSNKPKSSGIGAAVVAAAQAQAASEAKQQQQQHQMANAVNNVNNIQSNRATGNAVNSSPISAGRNSVLAKIKQTFGFDEIYFIYILCCSSQSLQELSKTSYDSERHLSILLSTEINVQNHLSLSQP